jgi:hypothetical protein
MMAPFRGQYTHTIHLRSRFCGGGYGDVLELLMRDGPFPNVTFFLALDDPAFREPITDYLRSQGAGAMSIDLPVVHSNDKLPPGADERSFVSLIADFFLVSEAQVMYLTDQSSFSQAAKMIAKQRQHDSWACPRFPPPIFAPLPSDFAELHPPGSQQEGGGEVATPEQEPEQEHEAAPEVMQRRKKALAHQLGEDPSLKNLMAQIRDLEAQTQEEIAKVHDMARQAGFVHDGPVVPAPGDGLPLQKGVGPDGGEEEEARLGEGWEEPGAPLLSEGGEEAGDASEGGNVPIGVSEAEAGAVEADSGVEAAIPLEAGERGGGDELAREEVGMGEREIEAPGVSDGKAPRPEGGAASAAASEEDHGGPPTTGEDQVSFPSADVRRVVPRGVPDCR